MADFYPYLIASLPMLHFGMKPPFSFERFIEICSPLIPEKDCHLLRDLPQPEEYAKIGISHRTIQKWIDFDVALRNELVKIRATKKHVEPGPYLRFEMYIGSSLSPTIMAVNLSSPIPDIEKILDETRWKALEELATDHYLDLDFLITYACKLLILQRWEKVRSADGAILLDHVLPKKRSVHEYT
jgi:hypothetical protein